ncbi:ribonuclease HII [Quadrisphaera sp. GCM10027208]|uniref:ribonuclease HII n=1 Tax=Quadrisphaera sp. GCM10027208 TaxID=3273423 RepID=UPI003605AD33
MTVAAARRGPRSTVPTLREERRLLRSGARLVAGVDEVGRGALAGPVTVGVVVVQATTRSAPAGLRDSKLLTPAAREALVPRLRRWATSWAVGHAEPHEIDAHGILSALRLAGNRALARLPEPPDAVLLDGSYDWLTRPALPLSLFGDLEPDAAPDVHLAEGCVRTLVKGDLRCAAVAAASVLAKTERDALMRQRAQVYPDYGWAGNKGYSAPEHLEALGLLGPCEQHRRSWRLPRSGPAGAARTGAGDLAAGVPEPGAGTVPLFEDPVGGTMAP